MTTKQVRPAVAKKEPKATTIKFSPELGAAIRLLAAINGLSAAELVEGAVRDLVKRNGKRAPKVERKSGAGRPPQSVWEAAAAVAKLRPGKNDSIPTRLHESTHRAFDRIATIQGRYMNDLLTESATEMVSASGIKVVRQIAGLEGEAAVSKALAQVHKVAGGGKLPARGWSGNAP